MDKPLVYQLFRQEQKLGSYVWIGYPLKASKREAGPEMRYLILIKEVRRPADDRADRPEV